MPERTEKLEISVPSGSFTVFFADTQARGDFISQVNRAVNGPKPVHNAYDDEIHIRPSSVHAYRVVY